MRDSNQKKAIYPLLQENQIKGKLSTDLDTDWYIFVPKLTGSYEVVCEGNVRLCVGIYNNTKMSLVNNSYVCNKKSIQLATTLKK